MRPHYSHSSRENATPSSGTSPLASCKGVPRETAAVRSGESRNTAWKSDNCNGETKCTGTNGENERPNAWVIVDAISLERDEDVPIEAPVTIVVAAEDEGDDVYMWR